MGWVDNTLSIRRMVEQHNNLVERTSPTPIGESRSPVRHTQKGYVHKKRRHGDTLERPCLSLKIEVILLLTVLTLADVNPNPTCRPFCNQKRII